MELRNQRLCIHRRKIRKNIKPVRKIAGKDPEYQIDQKIGNDQTGQDPSVILLINLPFCKKSRKKQEARNIKKIDSL